MMTTPRLFHLDADQVDAADTRPLLIVPYMWIGDFVRGQSVVQVLKQRWPNRPVDLLAGSLPAALVPYMPGVRQAITFDLPRGKLALARHRALALRLRREHYATAIIWPRTLKSALAPMLAGIPERIGFLGEMRFGLLTDRRPGEKALPRMIDQMMALALPRDRPVQGAWPPPCLRVPPAETGEWCQKRALDGRRAVVLAPGSVGPAKRWTAYPELARALVERGLEVWVVGGPGERGLAEAIVAAGGPRIRDLTGNDLRDAVRALAAGRLAIANDSGLLHVAAALGTPAIGIFGPTSPDLWKPLNDVAAIVTCGARLDCQPCHRPVCTANNHRCMTDISPGQMVAVVERAMADVSLSS